MNYIKGHVDPWWPDDFKNLDYVTSPFTNDSTILQWKSIYGDKLNFSGGLYSMDRTMPAYALPFLSLLPWENVTLSFYRMNTCEALPLHVDSYPRYRNLFNIKDPSIIWRCIVFLEHWKSGHYMEVNGDPLLSWSRGDYVFWNNDTPHFAGNFGIEPRYTVQITGTHV